MTENLPVDIFAEFYEYVRPSSLPSHIWFEFSNGYSLSVVSHGYGSDQGLYEVALLMANRFVGPTPGIISEGDDVEGYLTREEVATRLALTRDLPRLLPDGVVSGVVVEEVIGNE